MSGSVEVREEGQGRWGCQGLWGRFDWRRDVRKEEGVQAVGGAGKGDSGGGKGAKGQVFSDGLCSHCGQYGHRKSEFTLLTQKIQAKGKGRGVLQVDDVQEEPQGQEAEAGKDEWLVTRWGPLLRSLQVAPGLADFTRVLANGSSPTPTTCKGRFGYAASMPGWTDPIWVCPA